MTRDEVAALLGSIAAAYPGSRVSAEMVETWDQAVGLYEREHAVAAVRTWVRSEGRWPTLHQFSEAIEAEIGRASAARTLPAEVPSEPPNPGRASGSFRLLRRMVAAARDGNQMTVADVHAEVEAHGLAVDPDTVLYDCGLCLEGVGFIGVGSVVPCSRCRPEQRALYDEGHFRVGHSCETCRPSSRRRAS